VSRRLPWLLVALATTSCILDPKGEDPGEFSTSPDLPRVDGDPSDPIGAGTEGDNTEGDDSVDHADDAPGVDAPGDEPTTDDDAFDDGADDDGNEPYPGEGAGASDAGTTVTGAPTLDSGADASADSSTDAFVPGDATLPVPADEGGAQNNGAADPDGGAP
jgi:hypothetical protein